MKSSMHKFLRKKLVFPLFILASCFFLLTPLVFAFDPSLPNNKFGIHLAVPHTEDLLKASELVNSSGGKWGYVTLVIQENDRDPKKWQQVFEILRKNHLIPIIRLATSPDGAVWRRPKKEDAESWVSFLDSLNWVVKDRYIVLFNEPNHASEWGGEVNPEGYAEVADAFAKKLKERSADFFVILAGLDASAPSSVPSFEDEEVFLRKIIGAQDGLFDVVDGWASHAYPNPGFSGSPFSLGRGTVRGYEWEISILSSLGTSKNLPVFITETGWKRGSLSEADVAANLRRAFETVWLQDSRVRAVTPFVLDYQQDPFLGFSWKKNGSQEFYQQFETVQQITKVEGTPEQIEKGALSYNLPEQLHVDSTYRFNITLKNEGQAVWDEEDGYGLKFEDPEMPDSEFSNIRGILPGGEGGVEFSIKTAANAEEKRVKIALFKRDKKILSGQEWVFRTVPLPKLSSKINFFPKAKDDADDVEIQLLDQKGQVVFKKENVEVKDGRGEVLGIRNVYRGGRYRAVVSKPYYLPKETSVVFEDGKTTVTFGRLLPLDFNKDKKLTLQDAAALFKNPKLLNLFLP